MKRPVLVLALMVAHPASAQFMPELSGHWFNPEQDGHGLTVNVVDAGRTILYWYVYDEVGNPDWYLLDGLNYGPAPSLDENHRVEGDMWQCEGMRFGEFDPDRNQCVEVGDFVIDFAGCGQATLQWELDGESGQMPLQRLSHLRDLECPPVVSSKLVGDWKVSQSGPSWPGDDDLWYDISIDQTGYFEFTDGLACLWGGRLSERGDAVRVSYRTHLCGWDVGPIDLMGTYVSPFILCASGGACVEYPAAMGFQGTAFRPGDGEPFDVYLRFVIPPEDG
jgi:hypothetical protein